MIQQQILAPRTQPSHRRQAPAITRFVTHINVILQITLADFSVMSLFPYWCFMLALCLSFCLPFYMLHHHDHHFSPYQQMNY